MPQVGWLLQIVTAFLLLGAPVGFAVLKVCGRRPRASDLGLALGLGYAVLPALLLGELHIRRPWLVLPAVVLGVVVVGREWADLKWSRSDGVDAGVALLLAGFASYVNGLDVVSTAGDISFRAGWDVSDRAFYAAVARAVARMPPPTTENPLFAGVPLQGHYYPSLLALLLEQYAGIDLIRGVLVGLPVLGLFWLGLVTPPLMREAFGEARWRVAALTILLIVLGGDLSWLLPATNPTLLERTRHFFVFHSWSAQTLLISQWGLGVPLALALLLSTRRSLDSVHGLSLAPVSLLAGALFETRVFAVGPLIAGVLVAAAVRRDRRALLTVAAMIAGCLPWLALTLVMPARGYAPFHIFPLAAVRKLLVTVPAFEPVIVQAHANSSVWGLVLGVGTLLLLFGGFGLRLAGLARLVRLALDDPFHLAMASSMAVAVAAGLLLIGDPLPADGMQFLIWSQLVSWPYAAQALVLAVRPFLVAAAVAISCVAPSYYVAVKAFPERLTTIGALDRERDHVDAGALAACRWLERSAAPGDRLIVPLDAALDPRGTRTLQLALLSDVSIVAAAAPFSVSNLDRAERQRIATALYQTDDRGSAEAILERWRVRWVWEDAAARLRFDSARLRVAFSSAEVRLREFH